VISGESINEKTLSKLGLILAIIGLFILLYVYFAIIVFGDILYNPLTSSYVPLVLSIPLVRYLNAYYLTPQQTSLHLLIGDSLLFFGAILVAIGSIMYYYFRTRSVRYTFGKILLNYSVLVALLIFVPTVVLSQLFGTIYNVPAYKIGFPQWVFSVTASTCFDKAPGWSAYTPYCNFLNYGQLFIISLITLVIGFLLLYEPTIQIRERKTARPFSVKFIPDKKQNDERWVDEIA
jgi:hypothetical protein